MKLLDKYLIKQFLQTVVFGLLAFVLIFVVIDMMENLDDFIDQNVTADIIAHYYFVFTPEIVKLITPVAVLFAALFTAGKSANLSELTAIKASGVSLFRFMMPFLVTTLLICILSVYFSGYAVPMANKTKVFIERQYLKKGVNYGSNNIFFQDTKTKIVNIGFFDDYNKTAQRVSIQEFDPQDLTNLKTRIDADFLSYDTTAGKWKVTAGIKRSFNGLEQNVENLRDYIVEDLNFKPQDILAKQVKPEEMNLDQLKELANDQLRSGNDPTNILIEYHSRFAFAASSLIVVLFGLPISANKRKGGLAAQVGMNILVTFIYLVFMKVSQAFGKNGAIEPFITAWLANAFFFAAALLNLPRLRR